jgi:hypothetical protein
VDTSAIPGTLYTYGVQALGIDDLRSSIQHVKVRTPKAPPEAARLDGLFNIKLDETSNYGFQNFKGVPSMGWSMIPQCDRGVCPQTKLQANSYKDFHTMLSKDGSTYAGSLSFDGLVRCGDSAINATFQISFEPTRAGVVDDEWRVTKFAGTMTQRSSSQLGCVSSGVDYDIVGTLVD